MALLETLREECIAVDTVAGDKATVVKRIAELAMRSGVLKGLSEETLREALVRRERIGTTGFGNGIAIPHCAVEGIEEFVVGILALPHGADFESLDGKPVSICVFIVGPSRRRNEHIHLLSGISRILSTSGTAKEIRALRDPKAIREAFLRHAATDVEGHKGRERSLFHVLIQKDELFDKILTVFSELEGSSVSVVEARDAASHLNALPLFAGFLADKDTGRNRLVLAIVPRALANEALRRISTVAGDLDSVRGLVVALHDLEYCYGSLEY